jgi:hypothetical protein
MTSTTSSPVQAARGSQTSRPQLSLRTGRVAGCVHARMYLSAVDRWTLSDRPMTTTSSRRSSRSVLAVRSLTDRYAASCAFREQRVGVLDLSGHADQRRRLLPVRRRLRSRVHVFYLPDEICAHSGQVARTVTYRRHGQHASVTNVTTVTSSPTVVRPSPPLRTPAHPTRTLRIVTIDQPQSRWRETKGGWQRVPPPACPRCGMRWTCRAA